MKKRFWWDEETCRGGLRNENLILRLTRRPAFSGLFTDVRKVAYATFPRRGLIEKAGENPRLLSLVEETEILKLLESALAGAEDGVYEEVTLAVIFR